MSRYIVCVIVRNVKNTVLLEGCEHELDKMTFPNPDKDPTAKERAQKRADFLREHTGCTVYAMTVEEFYRARAG
jgi:hypothetical protein